MTRFDEEQKHIHYLDLDMENFTSVPKVLIFCYLVHIILEIDVSNQIVFSTKNTEK